MIATSVLETLEKRKETLLQNLRNIEKKIEGEQSKILIDCTSCHAQHAIGDLVYIQTHWYVHPYSCTGGDYWNEGEGNFKCPACNAINRLYNREEYQKLKHRFKEIVKTHER
jgi:rubrerythrin